jgi:hypothetical protein
MFENRYVYDIEVYPKYFLFVAKAFNEDKWVIIENSRDKMIRFWKSHRGPEWLGIGYNCHAYDDLVIRWYMGENDAYEASDNIINSETWRLPYEINKAFNYYSYDCFTRVVDKSMAHGVSLKTLEAYMGVPIDEEHLPFDYPDELTKDEIGTLIHYCKSDVINTERVCKIQNKLTGDMDGRVGLCELYNRPELINMTKARAAVAVVQGD